MHASLRPVPAATLSSCCPAPPRQCPSAPDTQNIPRTDPAVADCIEPDCVVQCGGIVAVRVCLQPDGIATVAQRLQRGTAQAATVRSLQRRQLRSARALPPAHPPGAAGGAPPRCAHAAGGPRGRSPAGGCKIPRSPRRGAPHSCRQTLRAGRHEHVWGPGLACCRRAAGGCPAPAAVGTACLCRYLCLLAYVGANLYSIKAGLPLQCRAHSLLALLRARCRVQ